MPGGTSLADGASLAARLSDELAARADPVRAAPMVRYMRDQFAFLGVMAAGQAAAWRAATTDMPRALPEPAVAEAARLLWDRPEREHQYLGCRLVNRHVEARSSVATVGFMDTLAWLVTTKPWWDTVDILATHAVGGLVRRYPELRPTMDLWLLSDDQWLARSALLHMNRWKADTDAAWLFAACLARSGDRDFFIRKAIGWALREYSKVDERVVVAFVDAHAGALSGLSRREALMWLERRRRVARDG
jgi:3-methyladenine DNA glycosylase AlkD